MPAPNPLALVAARAAGFVLLVIGGTLPECESPSTSAPGGASAPTTKLPEASRFDFPVSPPDAKGYYVAQGFMDHYKSKGFHLGEDWNARTGGNSDCGEPVFAAAAGRVTYARVAGPGWGKVVMMEHELGDGGVVETLYGHLDAFDVSVGDVLARGEKLGVIGDGRAPCGDTSPYYAHLHFEVRVPKQGRVGPGYHGSAEPPDGWVDPTEFIEASRAQ